MNLKRYWRELGREHQRCISESLCPVTRYQNLSLVLGALCIVATFLLLMTGGYRAGFETIHDMGRFVPGAVLETLSKFGETLVAICLIALFARRQPRVAWLAVLAAIYAAPLTYMLKKVCHASRPPAVLGDWVATAGPVLKLYSFPSGHTVTAFLLAACLAMGASRNVRILLFTLAAAVGASRVWMGVHWPIDVIAGVGVAGLSIGMGLLTMRLTPWGLGVVPHLLIVSLAAICAVAELMMGAHDPVARLLRIAIATTSLAVLIKDYVLDPMSPAVSPATERA
jgi:membrane-associated phospholipid phosphatase